VAASTRSLGLEIQYNGEPPFPNTADAFYLGMYPLMIVGLTKMVQHVAPGRDKASFIDAGVVGIAMFGITWVLSLDDVFMGGPGIDSALIVSLTYPVMDVALLAVAARLVVSVHLKHLPFAFIAGSIASLAIADTAYQIKLGNGTFQTGQFPDAFWLTFYVGFALAALHPSSRLQAPVQDGQGRLTGTQLAIMFFATLAVPMVDLFYGTQEDRVVTIIASALLFLLILIRVFGLMRTVEQGKDRLRHDAEHDALTGLSNRVLFVERTAQALIERGDKNVAVLFIDLDDFKTVNDSLGHQAGDALLAEVAERLADVVQEGDTVARFGGDEFAVLLESVVDRRDAQNVARRALEVLGEPIDLGTRSVRASASIGIAMDTEGEADVDDLMRNADVAMYLSKSRGKGRFEFFEPIMHEEAIERLDLKADLQRALDDGQFSLNYQPIFDLKTGKVDLVEALIRWRHPDRGSISPERFIPLAEENGMIVPIGNWVLREACKQLAAWHKIVGCEDISMSVNLSMRQLQDTALLTNLTNALGDAGLSGDKLVLEITESMLAVDADTSAGVLQQLKTIGVKLAIDDFGTGYSSLSYLKSFPVDAIKIDRSFINELHRSSTSSALVEAVVNLSQALGAYTAAEGIEYADQAGLLRKLDCDRGQGFYYCRPLPAPALTALFREHLDEQVEPLEAWRKQSEEVNERQFDVHVREGLMEIRPVAADLDELVRDLNMPVMASWAWLQHWSEAFEHWLPIMVEVRAAETQQLMACALLAVERSGESTQVVAMGHGSSLYAGLPSRNNESARALAHGIVEAMDAMSGAWAMDLEQLPEHVPVLGYLVEAVEQGQLLPELRIPRVVFSSAHTVEDVLTKSKRKQLKRARSRISNEGLEMIIAFDRGRAISAELLDEVEAVHVSRDRHARRNSDLDRPAEREFWRRVVEGGTGDWEVEIATLRLDGELAAYAVAILDGETYRIYDGRMSTEHQHYSPGRIIEAAALGRAISDPRFTVLDWMSGIAAEKLLTANFAEGRARLVATSGSRKISSHKRTRVSSS
jgi:diguanylate cyclase